MFLNQLSGKEKIAFLNLSIIIANANGILEEPEREMIHAYCKEMELNPVNIGTKENIESIIDIFKRASDHIKRVVVLEALGLAWSDGQLDPEEEQLMNSFSDKIGINKETYAEITTLFNKYTEVLTELYEKI